MSKFGSHYAKFNNTAWPKFWEDGRIVMGSVFFPWTWGGGNEDYPYAYQGVGAGGWGAIFNFGYLVTYVASIVTNDYSPVFTSIVGAVVPVVATLVFKGFPKLGGKGAPKMPIIILCLILGFIGSVMFLVFERRKKAKKADTEPESYVMLPDGSTGHIVLGAGGYGTFGGGGEFVDAEDGANIEGGGGDDQFFDNPGDALESAQLASALRASKLEAGDARGRAALRRPAGPQMYTCDGGTFKTVPVAAPAGDAPEAAQIASALVIEGNYFQHNNESRFVVHVKKQGGVKQ